MNFSINNTKFNDLVFENKNKNYGAYAIRRSQSDNLLIALFSSLSFFALIAFGAYWFSNRSEKIEIASTTNIIPDIFDMGTVIDVTPDKKVEPVKTPDKPEPPKSFSGQMVASDDKNKTLDKTTDQLLIRKDPNPDGVDSTEKKTDIPTIFVKKPEVVEKAEFYAQQMPEMEGMAQFIANNLVYPYIAKENGTTGTVYLTFVVEKDGAISDVKILKGIGDGCEQEAMRVVKMMPKWKPGINHGNPVRVQCNLPVKFKLK